MPNEATEGRNFYSLLGVGGGDTEAVRELAKSWLNGNATDHERAAALRPLRDAPRR
jgi:hypothetical protein